MAFKSEQEALPPPYEAEAYAHQPRPWRRLRKACSVPVFAALALTLVISWLCLLIERGTYPPPSMTKAPLPPSISRTRFQESLRKCAARAHPAAEPEPASRTSNPRWNAVRGHNVTVILRNATLFDGETFASEPVDIIFTKGLVTSVSPTSANAVRQPSGGKEYNLNGRYVTPGLVDMHSHHYIGTFPNLDGWDDGNEVNPLFGPLTPFLKALDGLKGWDETATHIMSGGVTSSLIIPGSANIMGGEGTVVKNALKSGELGEYVVEEVLLEHGIPEEDRHRYMKMACGENPKAVYTHNRMGLAWMLRQWLERAQKLIDKQEEWCEAASGLRTTSEQVKFLQQLGDFPVDLELESTTSLIRGRTAMHNHCYEPEDFETMLRVTHEYGIKVRAFHHAIEAWQVPEMLKAYGNNVTLATFAEFGFYKGEAYHPNLYAAAILDKHGLPVAFKSDHSNEATDAKYVLSQAAAGHAFHLPADKALQAVTSIAAKAIDLAFRIGYVRPGYDADIVVWDSHPLSIGATPQQVFIDGVPQLDPEKVKDSTGYSMDTAAVSSSPAITPHMRTRKTEKESQAICGSTQGKGANYIISGIRKSFLENHSGFSSAISTAGNESLTLVINGGYVACISSQEACSRDIMAAGEGAVRINMEDGHALPGLTALSHNLGIHEIDLDPSTGNGIAKDQNAKDAGSVDYAKYGVYLDGKLFKRARLGGVTRAITAPEAPGAPGSLLRGVSTGIMTSGTRTILDGGIFQSDVGLHVMLGLVNKGAGSVSSAVKTVREILKENKGKGNETVYGLVAAGELPLIVEVDSLPATQQVIAIKRDFPNVTIIISGGHAAPLVAEELAKAKIPVLLSATRPSHETWDMIDSLPGPPLTRSPARVLSEAGVLYAVSVQAGPPNGDSRIHDLALEASWAAKYAGLSEHEAVRLVSANVEQILGLPPSRDIVIWEGNPLQWGGAVALAFEEGPDGRLELATCWPDDVWEN